MDRRQGRSCIVDIDGRKKKLNDVEEMLSPIRRSVNHEKNYLSALPFGPHSFINISCGKEEVDDALNSRRNMVEVVIVVKIVQLLFKAWRSDSCRDNVSIGIISPFSAQVNAIQDKIGIKYCNFEGFSVEVKLLDEFQSGDPDLILLSTASSNIHGDIGYISNEQIATVTLKRPRQCLWILGDGRTLSSHSVWKLIIQDAMDRKCFYNAEDVVELSDVILEVKKELDQFDDLLTDDSVLFKSARWKVLFSESYRRSFEKLKLRETKLLHLHALSRLSSGWGARRIIDVPSSKSWGILKQFKVKDLYTFFSVDVEKDKIWIQVLKFWDILSPEDVPKMVKRFNAVIESYTDEHLSRCVEKHFEGDLVVPRSWNQGVERYKSSSNANSGTGSSSDNYAAPIEHCKVSDSLLLMKFYAFSSGIVGRLLAGCDGKEVELPFELNDQERELIHFNGSSFVLGRSGTGKTTVLLMKLLQREQLYHISLEGFHEVKKGCATYISPRKESECLRQIFIAVSSRLCSGVKQHISSLKRSCSWNSSEESSKTKADEMDGPSQFSDIPDSFVDLPATLFPLVISLNKFLMMLNGTVTESFFERFPDLSTNSQLKTSKSLAKKSFIREKEVTYDKFCSSYWPKLDMRLTKKLDPSTVFTEIISHIKGGYLAGESNGGKVSRKRYVSLSEARVSTLDEMEREKVYDIFLQYEKKKRECGEFDSSDIVIHLHRQLESEGYKGDLMDFVYVDEVQDLTMREVSLLKYVCRNLEEGYVFAGDTAQTIAKGVDFRFEDIRSLFYCDFILPSRSSRMRGREEKGLISDIYHLSENFRTHLGILKLGNSIIDLLYHFFPLSIDVLSHETSLVSGDLPVLIAAATNDVLLASIKGSASHEIVGFGAEQVVLVRDDRVKNEVVAEIGAQALVLTILECKGLEFQDVLVYNFFSSSSTVNEWEVVYGYMQQYNLPGINSLRYCPKFNGGRHMVLCSELKQLYVAITRSRQRLWFFEKDGYSKPIFEYWKSLGIVKERPFDDNFLLAFQSSSAVEEWKSRGIKLYQQTNYEMARMCFEKARDTIWVKLSDAAHLRSAAGRIRSSNPNLFRVQLAKAAQIYESLEKFELAAECYYELKELTKAAQIYESLDKYEFAAECYYASKEYEKAGSIYLEKFTEPRFEEAGNCFLKARCYGKAAEVYSRCNSFSSCLSVCASGKLFELGFKYIQLWKEQARCADEMRSSTYVDRHRKGILEGKALQQFLERGAVHFHKLKNNETMMLFVRSLNSEDQMRDLLMTLDCLDELLSLEIEWGNFSDAANIASCKGDFLLEAELLGEAGKFAKASNVILSYVLMHSLWKGKGWPLKTFAKKEELLTKAKNFAKNASDDVHVFVSKQAEILDRETWCLSDIRQYFSEPSSSIRGRILCARRALDICNDSCISLYQQWHNFIDDAKCHKQEGILDRVCVATLVYYWNSWKHNIQKILEYLKFPQDEDSHGEFCLSYLGVKKCCKNEKIVFLLLFPEADWLSGIDIERDQKSKNSIFISATQFLRAARRYWSSEMVSVGKKVFGKLKSFYQFSIDKNLSAYCKINLLIHLTEILFEMNVLSMECNSLLQTYLLSARSIYSSVCSLDWQNPFRQDMLSLRRFQWYKKLLGNVIYPRIRSEVLTSRREIVELTALLLSANLPANLYKWFAAGIENSSPWKLCIEDLQKYSSDEIQVQSADGKLVGGSINISLIQRFHRALEDAFYSDWERLDDYISPCHFLYLLDRLSILIFSAKGCFFTVKSSLIEWLVCHHRNAQGEINVSVDMQQSVDVAADFVAHVVEELLCYEQFTKKWLAKYSMDTHSYRLLVFRLFVILCLLCMNTGRYYDLLLKLFSRRNVSSSLPWSFHNSLCHIEGHNEVYRNIVVFAKVLKKAGCLLVIVEYGKCYAKQCPKDACLLDLSDTADGGHGFPGNDLQKRNKSFWMMLDFVISEKDADCLSLSDAKWFKAKISKYIHVVDSTMKYCRESIYFNKNKARKEMMDAMLSDLCRLHSAVLKSEWEANEKEIKDLVRTVFSWRKNIEPFVDNISAQIEANDAQERPARLETPKGRR